MRDTCTVKNPIHLRLVKKISDFGPVDAPIVVVGEAPGAQEVSQNRPFVGPAGWHLKQIVKDAGLNLDDMYLTNVCHYQPPGNDINSFFLTKTKAKEQGINPVNNKYPNWFAKLKTLIYSNLLAQSMCVTRVLRSSWEI